MRNLKKILALALVFAMAFTFTASAADFTDAASIDADYADDVNMLVELGVIAGYPDGSFGPEKNITRAEFAKMAYTIIYGSDTDGNLFAAQKSNFWDVEGNASVAWAKGYINYCANQKIVSGVGGGKFNPQGNITVAEASKMLLVILGCDPAKEGFTGANWMSNVVAKAMELGVYDGWQGDPSALATRELVAKLMANTILSSTYTYSSITGIGSQKDALGQNWNDTLGEKTMGLKTVTGIVVANERYALGTNAKGKALVHSELYEDLELEENEVAYYGDAIELTDEDEAMVLYETKGDDGSTSLNTITIDRALSDDMLGSKVNVFFKADKREDSKSGVISYVNIKVIGEVIVNKDTVVHTVPAVGVDMYPNGDSSSAVKVQPYIGFGDVQIVAKSSNENPIEKVAKDNDVSVVGDMDAIASYFEKNVYAFVDGGLDEDETLVYGEDAVDVFFNNMGLDVANSFVAAATDYRFVSVDGGKTYSYMFKLNSGDAAFEFTAVVAYNEARGTIKLSSGDSLETEDCVIDDGIEVDDFVVAYRANGKTVIKKVDVVKGNVEALNEDRSVTIGGNKYYAWNGLEDLEDDDTIIEFFSGNPAMISAEMTYYVYNNLILDIDTDIDVATSVDNYAVILGSYAERGTAYVKLGFADGTTANYEVGKLYLGNPSTPYEPEEDGERVNDVPADFEDEANMIGRVVTYKVLSNGTLDLSSQFLAAAGTEDSNTEATDAGINDGKFVAYGLNDSSIVFVIYGTTDGEANYLKAKAYKLADIKSMENDGTYSYVVYNKNIGNNNKYVVAGSIYAGEEIGNIELDETKDWSYIVSAKQKYDYFERVYSVDFVLVGKDGAKEISTIKEVTDFFSNTYDFEGKESKKIDAWSGGLVTYETDADGKISMMTVVTADTFALDLADVVVDEAYEDNTRAFDGFYYVNITGEKGKFVNFYDLNADYTLKGDVIDEVSSIKYHEDGYNIIGVSDGDYVGEKLYKVSKQQEELLVAAGANAIIELYEGKVRTIFSLADNAQLD